MNLAQLDLVTLNSITKYPSIPTYHNMVGGKLDDGHVAFEGPVWVTEKIDGTNVRVIQDAFGHFILGSRESLLTFSGDVLFDPAMGIVEALRARVSRWPGTQQGVRVAYFELHGGNIGKAGPAYGAVDLRLFDVVHFASFHGIPRNPPAISAWREGGGQPFAVEGELKDYAEELDVPLTPRLRHEALPLDTLEEAHAWLKQFEDSQAHPGVRAEGVVVRTSDRRQIAKLRFEDYERAARRPK